MVETLAEFFLRVTGKEILPYQERYGNDPFLHTLLTVATGLGKTDAVLIPWIFAQYSGHPQVPTRLIIVLPRQNLTEQTARTARQRVTAAGLDAKVRVLELMAGSKDNSETLGPEEPAIIVCTQDMYLSRALNRGYARRPPRWPIDFALFNNDCQIVFDEVQLMNDGLATSTQLAAMRDTFGTFGLAPCVWMSATVDPRWLDTVDFRARRAEIRIIELADTDRERSVVQKRYYAKKQIARALEQCRAPAGCANFALEQHRAGERTLIIANTVNRAREIYSEIKKQASGAVLLHSRFRPADRRRQLQKLEAIPPEGQIVVSTQVLEAGIDISANRLITDIAPWGSIVQRLGRTNRYGELDQASVWWVDLPLHSKVKGNDLEKVFAPYQPQDIEAAVAKLEGLESAAPADLPQEDGPPPWRYVLRRADLFDLFDTSPDLSGNEIDISRFIRSGEEKDVYLAWRNWEGLEPDSDAPEIDDDEVCPVPIGEAREFARKHVLYRWDFVQEEWRPADRDKLFPGMLLMTAARGGGYKPDEGWSPESKTAVGPVENTGAPAESDASDPLSFGFRRQLLRDHSDDVVKELKHILNRLPHKSLDNCRPDLERAAALHDWGKAHPVMQETLRCGEVTNDILAKSEKPGGHRRRHFRHELASALAMLATGESDLATYVVAAHHGRIRVSIRSMPGEPERMTRGILEGEELPACEPATGAITPKVTLLLDAMRLGIRNGGPISWTDRVIRLRYRFGPLRLSYLEMLLRAADERASASRREAAG